MSVVTGLLQEIRQRLEDIGAPVAAVLAPGRSASEVEDELGAVPSDVTDWFSVVGGTEEVPGQKLGSTYFIPGYYVPTPAEAAQARNAVPDLFAELDDVDEWVPLLLSGGADLYAAVWRAGEVPRVASYLSGLEPEVEYTGVDELLRTIVRSFESGAYFVVDGQYLEEDGDLFEQAYRDVTGREYDD